MVSRWQQQATKFLTTGLGHGLLALLLVTFVIIPGHFPVAQQSYKLLGILTPVASLIDPEAIDQDDMAFWIHPTDSAMSTIIASDKSANKIFVYDLDGNTIQSIPAKRPGNVDVRYGFPLGKEKVDIVAVNGRRGTPKILVFRVDPQTRHLQRVDDGSITTGKSTGGTLYRSPKTGKFYFVKTSVANGLVEQFELYDSGSGRVAGKKVREWQVGGCEGAVADDETGRIYIAEEDRGIWKLGGEPSDPVPGTLVVRVGEHGLRADVEGLTIYKRSSNDGYLIASNQRANTFQVYALEGAHDYLGTFAIKGARHTDGIDVTRANPGGKFPQGLFASHTDRKGGQGRPVLITPFASIAKLLRLAD